MNKTSNIETKQEGATPEEFAQVKLIKMISEVSAIDYLMAKLSEDYPIDLEMSLHKLIVDIESILEIYFGGDDD